MLVATVLGQVSGIAVLEWLHPQQSARAEAWLTALVTDAPARHRGIARALLEEAARRARQAGGDRLRLGCPLERDDLRAFLAAAGFEPRLLVFERPTV
ncbi:MAG: Acetyltransferase family [Myxococcaceae bacterium]|nr:Acetyltransferase family [Myxococcaceae bacterium]